MPRPGSSGEEAVPQRKPRRCFAARQRRVRFSPQTIPDTDQRRGSGWSSSAGAWRWEGPSLGPGQPRHALPPPGTGGSQSGPCQPTWPSPSSSSPSPQTYPRIPTGPTAASASPGTHQAGFAGQSRVVCREMGSGGPRIPSGDHLAPAEKQQRGAHSTPLPLPAAQGRQRRRRKSGRGRRCHRCALHAKGGSAEPSARSPGTLKAGAGCGSAPPPGRVSRGRTEHQPSGSKASQLSRAQ